MFSTFKKCSALEHISFHFVKRMYFFLISGMEMQGKKCLQILLHFILYADTCLSLGSLSQYLSDITACSQLRVSMFRIFFWGLSQRTEELMIQ